MRVALLALLAAPLLADTQFTARRVTREDIPLGKGQCDIRIQIDNEAEVTVDGDRVHIRTISGRDGRDDGSWCNEPLPGRNIRDFRFEVVEKRGEIALLDDPTSRGRAYVRIRDSKGGEGRYHFRLTWSLTGGSGGGGGGFGRPRRGEVQAIRLCEDAVRGKISSDYRLNRVQVRDARVENRSGRNDSIVGQAFGRRGGETESFSFACRVDFASGAVQSVDIERR